jgi:uncharacterized membrane protein YdjX (TVP38/TMEM64 family)
MKVKYKKFWLGVGALASVWLIFRYTSLGALLDPELLTQITSEYGALAPVFYIGIYVVSAVAFLPSSPLTLVGGVLFGPLYGTIYTLIGATLGSSLAFLLARYISGGFMTKASSGLVKHLAQYDERIAKHGLLTVIFFRLLPLFPFNGLNFALGLTRISFRDYVLGTFLGIIPGTTVLVFFGDSLASLNPFKIAVAFGLVVLLMLGGKWFIKRYWHK